MKGKLKNNNPLFSANVMYADLNQFRLKSDREPYSVIWSLNPNFRFMGHPIREEEAVAAALTKQQQNRNILGCSSLDKVTKRYTNFQPIMQCLV